MSLHDSDEIGLCVSWVTRARIMVLERSYLISCLIPFYPDIMDPSILQNLS
jgi:hypothetical protein